MTRSGAEANPKLLYRVKFLDRGDKEPTEVVVRHVDPSELFGLVCLSGFVFSDQKKFIILPDEDQARKRFAKTERLHLPYHNLLFVEEFEEEETDVTKLPFVKEVAAEINPVLKEPTPPS